MIQIGPVSGFDCFGGVRVTGSALDNPKQEYAAPEGIHDRAPQLARVLSLDGVESFFSGLIIKIENSASGDYR